MPRYLDDTDLGVVAKDLYGLHHERNKYGRTDFMQDVLGPAEHKQFMREATARNPVIGTAAAIGAPIYSGLKKMGLTKARSSASSDEIFAAWEGYGQGLKDFVKQRRKK